MNYISDEIEGQVVALEAREKALATRSKRLSPVWVALAGGTTATSLSVRFLGPDAHPSNIDVPAKILELFSANVPRGGGLAGITSASEQLLGVLSSLQPIMIGTAVIGIVAAGIYFAMSEDPGSAMKIVFPSMGMLGLIGMANILIGSTASPESSPREYFMNAVEERRFEAVASSLEEYGQHTTPSGLYVLAQVTLAEEGPVKKPRPVVNADLAAKIVTPTAGFTPKGEALYAIEYAAYGAAKSPTAVAYQEESLVWQGWARIVSTVFGSLTIVVGGFSLAFVALRHVIGRRVRRIRELLEMKGSS